MDRGRYGRNGIVEQGFRDRQGPRDQVEGDKTSSTGSVVEASRMEACLSRRSKTGTRVENRVRKSSAAQSQGGRWEGGSVHGG